jgi:hypothetical protein
MVALSMSMLRGRGVAQGPTGCIWGGYVAAGWENNIPSIVRIYLQGQQKDRSEGIS